jgi:DNA-binding transcriptional LysR family regulator
VLSGRVPDLVSLEFLLAVGRAGSLSAAAGELGVTQQAVSLRMRTLEALVGVPLLVRSARGSTLTDAGVVLAQWAAKVMDAVAELDAGLTSLRGGRQAQLRVAASLTIAEHLLPGWVVALRARQRQAGLPPSDVELTAANSETVAARVRDGAADLGFVEGPAAPAGLRSRIVGTDRLLVVVPVGHPWARRRQPLRPAELAATPLVIREEGSGTREALLQALRAELAPGAELAPSALELSNTAAIVSAVIAGAAPSVLSSLAVADQVALGRLQVVDVAGLHLHRALRAVWVAGAAPPPGPGRELVTIAAAGARRGDR